MLSPGEQLRRKRISFGLQIAGVAKELCLSESQVEALESGEHESLPGPTYIIGYWRSYANLMNLDIGDAILKYRAEFNGSDSNHQLEMNDRYVQNNQERLYKRTAFKFLILSIMFLGLVWFLQSPHNLIKQWYMDQNVAKQGISDLRNNSGSGFTTGDTTQQFIEPDNRQTLLSPVPNFPEAARDQNEGEITAPSGQIDPAGVVDVSNFEDSIGSETVTESAKSTRPDIEVTTISGIESNIDTSIEASDESVTEVSIITGSNPDTESNSAMAAEERVVNAVQEESGEHADENILSSILQLPSVKKSEDIGNITDEPAEIDQISINNITSNNDTPVKDAQLADRLVLKIGETNWIDVRDATGEKLVFRVVKKGEILNIQGEPPFEVYIEKASQVTAEYQGKDIQLEPYVEGSQHARLLIGSKTEL